MGHGRTRIHTEWMSIFRRRRGQRFALQRLCPYVFDPCESVFIRVLIFVPYLCRYAYMGGAETTRLEEEAPA